MKFFVCTCVIFYFILNALGEVQHTCKLLDQFDLNGLYKHGDIILGGIFVLSFKTVIPDLSFRFKPQQWHCNGFEISEFQRIQTMIFAIEEINKDQALLPNITLGYRMYDNCVTLPIALRAAISLLSGLEANMTLEDCSKSPPVLAVLGDPLSSHSIAMSRILSLFRVPMVSHYATCSCLSNKQEFPSFFRTIPSDAFQVKAIIQIIKQYRWIWIGAIASDDDYGQNAIKIFMEEVNQFGCIAFIETIPTVYRKVKILQIVNTIKLSTAKVIVAFSGEIELNALVTEVIYQNITGRQWIASEAWSTSSLLASKENFASFGGTIGIAVRRGEIPKLENFLLNSHPDFNSNNRLVIQFWEELFKCKFPQSIREQNESILLSSRICTGTEDMNSVKSGYGDVSELRSSYNVYKAVYAIAQALHNLMNCENGNGPFESRSCADIKSAQPWQLLHYLKKVNFTNQLGERVAFDENGDAIAIYDIVNWQMTDQGTVAINTIGVYDESKPAEQKISLKEDKIFWNFENGKAPVSVCSSSCLPGTRKVPRKGEPICCFDCIACSDGEVSRQVDATTCVKCAPDFWSNFGRNECLLKEMEFLSYEEPMGITLTTVAIVGACFSVAVLGLFIHFRSTPVVKANNSELSFFLLASLTLCFLCTLCFVGQPSKLTCMLRHVVFGISFVLCVSCILVKTIVVIMAFKSSLPGSNAMKWFGIAQQRSTVFFFTFVQSLICIVWLTTAPPIPAKNTKYQAAKIILECDLGSLVGFSFILGYIGLLAAVCFVIAFLARNLPDNFNEARFITFSMLIFCAVWITFIPAYISSPGKHTVAVEIFAILASSFGVLFAIFTPKCYIIIFKPQQNTRRAVMRR
ncbi:extracellular calcium-sensing receptor-like [Erpetoichthys calabaricus]|uniref:extracellular calcium-sensing receptor-like n=1 Tax=Erpetoichthys calabaricus TaxID=27687 RepID=UPI0022340151|nr:extracellular calcium-sensing receptor-like [Erpetoichthys calabaricus]